MTLLKDYRTQTNNNLGIGVAISRNLASKGANLVLNFTSESSAKPCNDLATSLTDEFGVTCLVVQADMGTPEGPAHISKLLSSIGVVQDWQDRQHFGLYTVMTQRCSTEEGYIASAEERSFFNEK